MAHSLVGLWLLAVWIFSAGPCHGLSPVLPTVISAVGKIIKHYQNNFHELNLDGLFGLRVLEGQLMMLSEEHSKGGIQHVTPDVVESINHYRMITSEISRLAVEAVKKDDEEYFNSMAYVVAHPWVFHNPHRKIDKSYRWGADIYKKSMNMELSESVSDSCMGQLTGNAHSKTKGCQITKKCVDIMTYRGLTAYGITHQLLWNMLGEKAGCRPQLEEALAKTDFGSLDKLRLELCTNNYYEMNELVYAFLNGTITPKYQDLFLEQQFVCANLGFGEFLSLEFLKDILSWQKEDGCFGKMQKIVRPKYANIAKFERIRKTIDSDYDYDDSMNINVQRESVVKDIVKMDAGADLRQDTVNKNNLQHAPSHSEMKFQIDKSHLLRNPTHHLHSHDSNPPIKRENNQMVMNPANQLHSHHSNSPIKRGNNAQQRNPANRLHSQDSNPPIRRAQRKPVKSNHIPGVGLRKLLAVNQDSIALFAHKENYQIRSGPRRRLLVEKEMSGGCLSHKTAVAAGALVMYLRYLIDPGDTGLDKGTGSIKLVDPGKKRDILQQGMDQGEAPYRDEEQPGDRVEAYGNEAADGDDGDDYDDGDDDGEEYRDAGEAKLAGRNLIHMKRLGEEGNFQVDKAQQDLYDKGMDLQDNNNNIGDDNEGDKEDYKGDNQQNNDEEYPYYDESEEDKKLKGKHFKELPNLDLKQKNPAKIQHLETSPTLRSLKPKAEVKTAERTMVVIFLACFVVLFLFMFRFIKKRRIHIRYHTRTFFGL